LFNYEILSPSPLQGAIVADKSVDNLNGLGGVEEISKKLKTDQKKGLSSKDLDARRSL